MVMVFFALRSIDGETVYTRNGSFTWAVDANGNTLLTNHEGWPVLDTEGNAIVVPQNVGAEAMMFQETGEVGYMLADGTYVNMEQQIALYQFNNPSGLDKLGHNNLQATAASGDPMLEGTVPGLRQSKILSNYLEGSNVNVADEMVNLIIAQRAYELNSKAITTADSMLDTANNLRR